MDDVVATTGRSLSIYGPLKVAVGYVVLTIFLHVFGPWEYRDEVLLPVLLYMVCVLGMFSLGYHGVARKWRHGITRDAFLCERSFRRFVRISKVGMIIQLGLTLSAAGVDYFAGRMRIDLILNPGQIYIDALDFAKDNGESSLLGQIKTLAAPVFYLSNAFFLLNYNRMKTKWVVLLVLTLFVQLAYGAITKGAQKGFFDLLILVVSVGIFKVFFNREEFRQLMKRGSILLIAVISVFVFFQISRMSAYGAWDYAGTEQMKLDRNGVLFSVFGDSIGLGLALFIGYLSQGYYGLSLCLQLPFEWTYGLGNSFALTAYAEQYFGIGGIFAQTYPYRMEVAFGWPSKMYWHTLFPWIASDLTFPGSVVLMYLIGRLYARSFIQGLVKESPLAVCMFYFLTTLILYLPANNQLMQTREMTIGFVVISAAWVLARFRIRGA